MDIDGDGNQGKAKEGRNPRTLVEGHVVGPYYGPCCNLRPCCKATRTICA